MRATSELLDYRLLAMQLLASVNLKLVPQSSCVTAEDSWSLCLCAGDGDASGPFCIALGLFPFDVACGGSVPMQLLQKGR